MKRFSRSAGVTAWTTAAIVALSSFIGLVAVSRAERPNANNLMRATYTISGTVLDTSGKPAANIPVRLLQPESPRRGPSQRDPNKSPSGDSSIGTHTPQELQKGPGGKSEIVVAQKPTDSAGHFSFPNLAPGKYAVMAGVGKAATRQEVEITAADPPAMSLKLNAE